MKINLRNILFLFSCILLFSDCKKEKETEITLEYPIIFFQTMERDTLKVDSIIIRESIDFPTQLEGELAKNNTTKSKIKSAKLIFMRIQVMDYAFADSNQYCNLGDLEWMKVDIKKDGVGQMQVASKAIPFGRVKAVNLDISDAEGRDYLKEDNFKFTYYYKKRRILHHEMPFVLSLRFKIIADPI